MNPTRTTLTTFEDAVSMALADYQKNTV